MESPKYLIEHDVELRFTVNPEKMENGFTELTIEEHHNINLLKNTDEYRETILEVRLAAIRHSCVSLVRDGIVPREKLATVISAAYAEAMAEIKSAAIDPYRDAEDATNEIHLEGE